MSRSRRRGGTSWRWAAAVAGAVLVVTVAVVAVGCGGPSYRASAIPRPPVVPGEVRAGPDLHGVQLPNFIMPLISGGVSVPRQALTPGAVATTSTTKVCDAPPAAQVETIPLPLENAVFTAYGYTNPANHNRYILDLLVPVSLGGAMTAANIWPAAVKGTGFFEKVQLDHVLKNLVCHRFLTLRHAQRALEADWYAAWLKYVVATGHF